MLEWWFQRFSSFRYGTLHTEKLVCKNHLEKEEGVLSSEKEMQKDKQQMNKKKEQGDYMHIIYTCGAVGLFDPASVPLPSGVAKVSAECRIFLLPLDL